MLLFIVSLFVLIATIITVIVIIGYAAAAASHVIDVVKETEIEVKKDEVHPYGEDVNDVIELKEASDELHES